MAAIEAGDLPEVKAQVESGADIDFYDRQRRHNCPIAVALEKRQWEIAAYLLSLEPRIKLDAMMTHHEGENIFDLIEEAMLGYPETPIMREVVETIIARAPDVQVMGRSRWRPVHQFAALGAVFAIEALEKRNASLNALDADRYTPVMRAAMNYQTAMVDDLIARDVDINAVAEDGRSLLDIAMQEKAAPNELLALKVIQAGFDLDIKSSTLDSWLELALFMDSPVLVRALHARGQDINERKFEDLTLLMRAVMLGKVSVTKELLRLGADDLLLDSKGKTAYDYAEATPAGNLRVLFNGVIKARIDGKGREAKRAMSTTPVHVQTLGQGKLKPKKPNSGMK